MFGLASRGQRASLKVDEQQVILTWNPNNGKIKSVYWNKHEIKHLVRFQEGSTGSLECSWRLRTGEELKIIVRPQLSSERDRYTLSLDGEDFGCFPTIRELDNVECFEDGVQLLDSSSLDAQDPLSDHPDMGYRLSMAGLSKVQFSCGDQVEDELHSDLYSPLLDSLRRNISKALPQAEAIVSRAIAHAFCTETGSITSTDSLSVYSLEGGCPSALEASVLKGAFEWIRSHPSSNEDEQLHFLSKLIDELLMHFRNENIDSDETSRIILGAAVVLGLELQEDVPHDTVLVYDIPKQMTERTMTNELQNHGTIETAAIAPFSGVGFVRFKSEQAAKLAVTSQLHDAVLPNMLLVATSTDFASIIGGSKYVFPGDVPKMHRRFRLETFDSTTTLDSTEDVSDIDDD